MEFGDRVRQSVNDSFTGYWSNVGSALKGYFWTTAKELVSRTLHLVLHPGELIDAAWLIYKHPELVPQGIWDDIKEKASHSEGQGQLAADAVLVLIPVTKAKDLARIAQLVKKFGKVIPDGVVTPKGAADFVDMSGRVPSTLYDSAKLGRLERYLGRRGVTLKVGDEFVPDGAAGPFSRDGTSMVLRSNPAQYKVWHELSHFRHSQKIGREAYSKLPRTLDFNAPEQHVFDLLENSPRRWNSLNFDQQQHSISCIERIGCFR